MKKFGFAMIFAVALGAVIGWGWAVYDRHVFEQKMAALVPADRYDMGGILACIDVGECVHPVADEVVEGVLISSVDLPLEKGEVYSYRLKLLSQGSVAFAATFVKVEGDQIAVDDIDRDGRVDIAYFLQNGALTVVRRGDVAKVDLYVEAQKLYVQMVGVGADKLLLPYQKEEMRRQRTERNSTT